MKTKHKIIAGIFASAIVGGGVYLAFAGESIEPEAAVPTIGYVGQPAVTNTIISDGQQKLFSIDYRSSDWSGNLHAYLLNKNGNFVDSRGTVGAVDQWADGGGARAMITSQDYHAGRFIATYSGTAGIPFRWSELTNAQKGALDATTDTTASISPLLDYIRGDVTHQMSSATTLSTTSGSRNYRYRQYALGDIIHSTPVYCSASNCRTANDTATVFVGANDGMLHAINADNGSERFAYVPLAVHANLNKLAKPSYNTTHTYFVDGRLAIKTFTTSTASQTILAGALGGGGRALFGLDVTSADASSDADAASKVLWEISNTSTGYENLGYVYGQPILANVKTMDSGGTASVQAALIVPNGYNSTTGKATLYVINPRNGSIIKEIDTTSSGSSSSPNGLSSVALWDADADGVYDTAYGGDMDGHLWKFDLAAGTAALLFTTDPAQPITAMPGIYRRPNNDGVMVTFGTGRLFTATDMANPATHYIYGIWDGAPTANTALVEQTLTSATYAGTGSNGNALSIRVRYVATTNTPDWTDGHHKGWKVALPIGGERLIGDGAYVNGSLFQFLTHNPTITNSVQPNYENWWMQLNVMTGGGYDDIAFDMNGDGAFNSLDQISLNPQADEPSYISPVGRNYGSGIRSQLLTLRTYGNLYVHMSNYDQNLMPTAGTTSETSTGTVTTVTESETTTGATVSGNRGVAGGHFDFDFYCNRALTGVNCSNYSSRTGAPMSTGTHIAAVSTAGTGSQMDYIHIHEYDDIFDVTGVNMLNPSEKAMNLNRVLSKLANTTSSVTTEDSAKTTGTATYLYLQRGQINPPVYSSEKYGAGTSVSGYPTTETSADGQSATVINKVSYPMSQTKTYTDGMNSSRTRYKVYRQTTTWTRIVTTTQVTSKVGFKILVANQAYSPAARVKIGDSSATLTQVYNYQTAAGLTALSIPTYYSTTLSNLVISLPVTAFNAVNWGTGVVRTGLHPTVPDCVVTRDQISRGTYSGYYRAPVYGPSNEWRNGALTVQIVKSDGLTNDDIRMNVANHPELGYVLKETSQTSKLIAEYTIFWHAPKYFEGDRGGSHTNGGYCMAEAKWNNQPLSDTTSDAQAVAPQYGSMDPKEGVFGDGCVGSGCSTADAVTVLSTTTTTAVNNNADGSTTTIETTVTVYSDGSTRTHTKTTTETPGTTTTATTGGNVSSSGDGSTATGGATTNSSSTNQVVCNGTACVNGGDKTNAAPVGRINWREFTL